MSDKVFKATDEVGLIRGMSQHFPEPQTNVETVYALGAAYLLIKAISNAFTRP
jgi:hypothetical protein